MRSVVSRGLSAYGYQHRVLMTGTPLQNNTEELWSLLNFIEGAKFPDFEKFKRQFGVVKTQEQVESLQRRLSPHLLRRVKEGKILLLLLLLLFFFRCFAFVLFCSVLFCSVL